MKGESTIANHDILFVVSFFFFIFCFFLSYFTLPIQLSSFPIFLPSSSMTSKASAIKLLDTICFHSTLVLCTRPCSACDCMTGQGRFILLRPSINSIQKAFPAGGTQPSSRWPLPLLSTLPHLQSCSDGNTPRQSHIWTTAGHWLLMLQGQAPIQCKQTD